jgi:antitoxin component of MazEF toxin-antitoxin module
MDISIEIQEDATTKELYIEIPEEIIEKLNWGEGTIVNWEVNEDNSIKISTENSREQSRKVNISQATEEDWNKFWSEDEGFGFH